MKRLSAFAFSAALICACGGHGAGLPAWAPVNRATASRERAANKPAVSQVADVKESENQDGGKDRQDASGDDLHQGVRS